MIGLATLFLGSAGAITLPVMPLTLADKGQIAAAVRAKLDDPDSAQFKWPAARNAGLYCGWVNWRGRRGIFTGFLPFAVVGGKRHGPKSSGRLSIHETTIGSGMKRSTVQELCNKAGFAIPSPIKN